MKKILKIFLVLFVVLILFLGVILFFAHKILDPENLKTQLAGELTKTLDRSVAIKDLTLDFSWLRGLGLRVSGFSIAEDPSWGQDNLFSVKEGYCHLDVITLLRERRVLISRLDIVEPRIKMIRRASGEINLQALTQGQGAASSAKSSDTGSTPVPSGETSRPARPFSLETFNVKNIFVVDGDFSFNDLTQDPPVNIRVKDIDIHLAEIPLQKTSPFNISFSLWSETQNMALEGLWRIDPAQKKINISQSSFTSNLGDLSLDKMGEEIPALNDSGFNGTLTGILNVKMSGAVFDPEGLKALDAEAELTDGAFIWPELEYPIENIDFRLEADTSDIVLREFSMYIASGRGDLSGRIDNFLSSRRVSSELTLENIDLSEIAQPFDLPVGLEGKLSGRFSGKGQAIDADSLTQTFKGEGGFHVNQGKIKDVNVLKLVLDKISMIPNLTEKILETLPETYKEKMKSPDTVIQKLSFLPRVHQGQLFLNKIEMEADGFSILANGKLTPAQDLSLAAEFLILPELSASMINAVPELSSLLNEQKSIYIPLKPYTGKINKFVLYPDFEYLTKVLINRRGKDELKKVIFKALDIEEDQPVEEGGETSEDTQNPNGTSKNVSPEGILIENVLDAIFK